MSPKHIFFFYIIFKSLLTAIVSLSFCAHTLKNAVLICSYCSAADKPLKRDIVLAHPLQLQIFYVSRKWCDPHQMQLTKRKILDRETQGVPDWRDIS